MGDPLTRRFAPQNMTERGRRHAAMWPPSSNSTDRGTPEGAAPMPEASCRSCTGRAVVVVAALGAVWLIALLANLLAVAQLLRYSGITAADRASLVATAAATAAVLIASGLTRLRVR
jgi:hypothetical protein